MQKNQMQRREEGGGELNIRPADDQAMAIATTRAAQEVQAAMVVAKRFPRDTFAAEKRIMEECKRPALAEQAIYAYPRGGTTVEGPSIRLAEVLARNWGNIDTGIIELSQANGESVMMAVCWDLETNFRQTKTFTVKHERHTRQGVKELTDPRDIYEMTANQGARRQRACILGVIPGDIVEAAVNACNKTMTGTGGGEPLADRAKKMIGAFEGMGVTQAMVERRLGHKLDTIIETEMVIFRKIYKAIQDNMQPVSAYFGDDVPAHGSIDVSATLGRATETTSAPGGTAEEAPKPKPAAKPKPKPDPDEDTAPLADDDDASPPASSPAIKTPAASQALADRMAAQEEEPLPRPEEELFDEPQRPGKRKK